ncbi:MAG: beta-ketoacyl-ACP synthase II [Bdellovibrionota bacterium]|nr:MAG: beta-ketoacyl-ACP synthase II [Bdellovibrionota bacterium]
MTGRRVVITGLGVISPLGNSVAECWNSALQGRSGVGPITRFDASQFSTTIAAEVKNFDPLTYIETKEVKKLDLFSQYALGAAVQAWEHAGLGNYQGDRSRIGCILGIGIGGLTTLEKYYQLYIDGGPRKISPFLIPAMISNLGPGNIAIRLGCKGINYVTTSACTSSTHALGEAYRIVREGLQDVVISGGSESAVTHLGIGGFCAMKALSTRNDEPTRASRPFDKDRDGFVLGEGSAVLVVEALESAEKRGAPILAELTGYGFSCDAYHITAPCSDGEGAVACMKAALASACIEPAQVSYVNAHGTSTPANDVVETAAIKQVFGPHAHKGLMVSSTKSMTGHLLGAAGAIEALFCCLAIRDGRVPPTINLEVPDEGCDLDYVANAARTAPVNHALSNSFGFGGTNASLVLSKFV